MKAIIPFEEFERVYAGLYTRACEAYRCPYSRTNCHVRECLNGIRSWWERTNGPAAPGFVNYERVIRNAIQLQNKLYWCFWTEDMRPCRVIYDRLVKQVRAAFKGAPLDDETSHLGY